MDANGTTDRAAAARHERFGTLPERISYADMVEERPAGPGGAAESSAESPWTHFSCWAVDVGL